MPSIAEPTTEAEWRAQDDARTLARAKEIEADSQRLEAAKSQARVMLAREQEELKALKKVAGRGESPARTKNTRVSVVNSPNSDSSSFDSFRRIV